MDKFQHKADHRPGPGSFHGKPGNKATAPLLTVDSPKHRAVCQRTPHAAPGDGVPSLLSSEGPAYGEGLEEVLTCGEGMEEALR